MHHRRIPRRQFFRGAAALAGTLTAVSPLHSSLARAATGALPVPSPKKLPRWRGFNLLEKFTEAQNAPFRESDFEWIAEWGFDFVRLPLSYHCWSRPGDWKVMDERVLRQIDQAVEFGKQYRVHVNLNFHRAPGYCVNPPKEIPSLWDDEGALEGCAFVWAQFARRYRGIPSSRVSFDLLNEPPGITAAVYARVVRRLVDAIRSEDPNRLIIADGLQWGRTPVVELADLGIAQSTRGYDPMRISHYQASWIGGSDQWPEPTWPLQEGSGPLWDKARLQRERIEPWQALEQRGVGVHVGEWGAFNRTPHAVTLAWMADNLALWQAAGWGWALWNLRGSFGVVDSERRDVQYENWKGHQLDRRMLELLRAD